MSVSYKHVKGNTVFTARMYEPKAEKTSILVVNLDKQGPSACSIVSPLALRRYVTEQNKFMWKESLKKKKTQKDAESQWGGGGGGGGGWFFLNLG